MLPPGLAADVEQLLTGLFGGGVRLGDGEILRGSDRSKVFRFGVAQGPDGAPPSIIVKHLNRDRVLSRADRIFPPEWLFFNDWAGLKFIGDVFGGDRIVPRLYGGNREACLFVMEDLGRISQLDHYLMGADAGVAERALIRYSRAMGRMHARTCGKERQFRALRDSLGPMPDSAREFLALSWMTDELGLALEALGLTTEQEAEREIRQVIEALRSPGPFSVYTHGDCCPDNCLFVDSEPILIDFEGGGFFHALLEGTYSRIPFPSCWCVARLPAEIGDRMESVYRSELEKGCPAAGDDGRYFRAVVECCAYWALDFLRHFPLKTLLDDDRPIVVASARQRMVTNLGLVWNLSERHGHCEALGAVLGKAARKLRELWPGESCELPDYPVFVGG